MRNKHYSKGIMLDPGAAVSVCPVDYFPECGIQPSRRIELQAADGSPVEHYGSKDVFYMVGNEVMKVRFQVTSVKAPILSLVVLEDAGCRLGHQGARLVLRRGDLSLQVDRVRVKPDLVADHVCGLDAIELERQQVRMPELLPEEQHIRPRSKALPKEPSIEERRAHELTHLPARSWCETCVKSFGLEDPHRRRRGGRDKPELQVDCTFMGRQELICALHAIDTEFLARTVIRADKGPIDFVIHGILEFLGEIGRKRMIRSDSEPAVKALVQAVALHREDETVIEEIPVKSSQSIGCNELDHFLVGGMARALRIDMEKRFGDNFPVLHAVYSWILRHSGWLLNRFCVGRDGYTAFQRYKGRIYNGEVCDIFECVLFKVPSPEEAKLDDRFRLGVWIGKTSRGDEHLIFDGDEVRKCRTVKRRPEYLRWDRVRVDVLILSDRSLHKSVFLVIGRSVGLHQKVWRDTQLQGLCG